MSRRTRLTQLALLAAGAYAVTGALELSHDQPTVFADPLDYVIEATFAAGLAASVVVLLAIGKSGLSGRPGTVGWSVAAAGNAALAVAALATAIEGREALDPLFPLGFLAIVVGYLMLAVVDARRRLVPPRAGLVLLIGFIATAVVDNLVTGGGTLVLAATWAALGRLITTPDAIAPSGGRAAWPPAAPSRSDPRTGPGRGRQGAGA